MTTKTHIHNPTAIKADSYNRSTWLAIEDKHGNGVVVFMPLHEAEAIQAAWEETQIEPEPLDAESIAARQAEAKNHVINAGRGHLVQS